MELQKLTALTQDFENITAVFSKYTQLELTAITTMSLKKIEINPVNILCLTHLLSYGEFVFNQISAENLPIILRLLRLDTKTIDELLSDSSLKYQVNEYGFREYYGFGKQTEQVLYFLQTFPTGDQELYDLFDTFQYQLNNNNPYQGWNRQDKDNLHKLPLMLETLHSHGFHLPLPELTKSMNEEVRAIIALVDCEITPSQTNIQILIAMGESCSNYSIHRNIIQKYFPSMYAFQTYVKRDLTASDINRVINEMKRTHPGITLSSGRFDKVDTSRLNMKNCLPVIAKTTDEGDNLITKKTSTTFSSRVCSLFGCKSVV